MGTNLPCYPHLETTRIYPIWLPCQTSWICWRILPGLKEPVSQPLYVLKWFSSKKESILYCTEYYHDNITLYGLYLNIICNCLKQQTHKLISFHITQILIVYCHCNSPSVSCSRCTSCSYVSQASQARISVCWGRHLPLGRCSFRPGQGHLTSPSEWPDTYPSQLWIEYQRIINLLKQTIRFQQVCIKQCICF